jgi:hypothetical protein
MWSPCPLFHARVGASLYGDKECTWLVGCCSREFKSRSRPESRLRWVVVHKEVRHIRRHRSLAFCRLRLERVTHTPSPLRPVPDAVSGHYSCIFVYFLSSFPMDDPRLTPRAYVPYGPYPCSIL